MLGITTDRKASSKRLVDVEHVDIVIPILYGLSEGVGLLFTNRQGPFPLNIALVLEQPGPPPNQAARGAVSAFLRASKL